MKKFIFCNLVLIFLAVSIGLVCKQNFKDSGINTLQTIEDTYKIRNCQLEYCFGDNQDTGDTEKELYSNLCEYEKDYINDSEKASIVVIGEPTGKIGNYADSFAQEIKVKKIIKGNNILVDRNYYVFSNENFELNDQGKVLYTGLKNIMKPKGQYLIFLDPSELNGVSDEKTYYLRGGFFSYLDITKDHNVIMKKPIPETYYRELKNAEFYVTSDRLNKELNYIKNEIIKKYNASIS